MWGGAVDPERPRRSVALGVVAVLASVGESAATHGFSNLASGVGTVVGSIAWVGAPLVLGHFIATRRAYTASLAERAHLAEQTREEEGQRRVTEERLRIARE
jgi:signal transduction histidine kinase